jgi:hypothetical protein
MANSILKTVTQQMQRYIGEFKRTTGSDVTGAAIPLRRSKEDLPSRHGVTLPRDSGDSCIDRFLNTKEPLKQELQWSKSEKIE